jgi:predicted lipoprotein with Yx(FWY)xxD motif
MKALLRAALATATALLLAAPISMVSYAHTSLAAATAVKVASAQILVTPTGFTLYTLTADPPNKSTCYNTCAMYWPPLLVAKGTQPAATVPGVPGIFGVTVRTDGSQQVTYDHAPLYTFLLDKKPGDMKGQGRFKFGGYWWMLVAGGGE